jgi:hypothetical protein
MSAEFAIASGPAGFVHMRFGVGDSRDRDSDSPATAARKRTCGSLRRGRLRPLQEMPTVARRQHQHPVISKITNETIAHIFDL